MAIQHTSTSSYDVTILVPVYNEEDNMRALSARLAAYLPAAKKRSCVLFINDGSTDKSGALIREACAEHEGFFFLEFARNCGLSAALKAGMDAALSPYVAYIDADLQTAPEELDLLTPYLDEYALVTGVRAKRKDSAFKKFQSRVANGFRRMMVKDGARDTGCPLKVMHTDMARRLPFFKGMHRFFAALVQMEGGKVKQVDVSHFPRVAGESKFHLWNRLISPLMDCFAVRWMQKRHIDYVVKEKNLGDE